MATAATIAARLILDKSDYDSGMKSAGSQATDFSNKMKNVGSKLSDVGGKMTAAVTLPLLAAGAASVELASSYDESLSKANVVFGENGKSIETWAQDAATNMGISSGAAIEAAGTYGNLFVTMGLASGQSADMSKSLIGLASDLGSFNNANPSDVLDALRSGLIGQSEPLRKFGINMSEAAVQAKAVELGLAGADDELTDSMKLQARYAIIMDQTKTAQGDFARTSDGLANSQRIMTAELQDAGVTLGRELLPYITQFVHFLSDLIKGFKALSPEQKKWIVGIGLVVAAIGPILLGVGSVVTMIGGLIPVIGAVITAISGAGAGVAAAAAPLLPVILAIVGVIMLVVGAVALLVVAWQNNWGGVQDKVAEVIGMVQPLIQDFIDNLVKIWNDVLLPALKTVWNWIVTVLFPIFNKFVDLYLQAIVNQIRVLIDVWKNVLWPALQVVFNWISTVLMPFLATFARFIGSVLGVAFRVMAAVWRNILWPAIQAIYNKLAKDLMPIFKALSDWWTKTGQPIAEKMALWFGETLTKAFDNLGKGFETLTGWLDKISQGLDTLTLPDWLTPGSPTPLEIGVLGINKAMKALTGQGVLDFKTSFDELVMSGTPSSPLTTTVKDTTETRQSTTDKDDFDYDKLARILSVTLRDALLQTGR